MAIFKCEREITFISSLRIEEENNFASILTFIINSFREMKMTEDEGNANDDLHSRGPGNVRAKVWRLWRVRCEMGRGAMQRALVEMMMGTKHEAKKNMLKT